jgi:hypothetical protein
MTYDHWKTRSDRDDWAAQNQPLAYDDDHWRELMRTMVERIGIQRFCDLVNEVLLEKPKPDA